MLTNRLYHIFYGLFAIVLLTVAGHAAPDISVSSQFTPANYPSRTWMDVGGVWNGSTDVTDTTGDTFSVTYNNQGTETAFDFTASVTLPNGFHYVDDTAQVATPGLSVNAVQTGNQLVFEFDDPEGYDLPESTSLTISYGLRADGTLTSDTRRLTYQHNYSLTEGGPPLSPAPSGHQQNVLVVEGDSILQVSLVKSTLAVGETAEFTVRVVNTGLGGLFDVVINESLINASNLSLVPGSLQQTTPDLEANIAGNVLTLDYLAPGEVFTITLDAVVMNCGTIVNEVSTTDRTGKTASSYVAPIQLDFQQPLITFATPVINLDYIDPTLVSIDFDNTGLGSAKEFVFHTSLNDLPLTISNVSPGWSYDSATGDFTLAGEGVIPNAGTANLTFTVESTDICGGSGAGGVFYETTYRNMCDDPYFIPKQFGSVTAASNAPSLSVSKSVEDTDAGRIAVNYPGRYVITLSASNLDNIATDPIVVTDVLPAEIEYLTHTVAIGEVVRNGNQIEWTVPKAALSSSRTLEIDFRVVNDPCLAGQMISNTVETGAVTVRGCDLDVEATASFYVSNNPDVTADQFFNLTAPPSAGGFFETGISAMNPSVRNRNEGEQIPFEASYSFSSGYPGNWVGSVYEDNFGSVPGQTLVPGSLTYTFDNGVSTSGPHPVDSNDYTVSNDGLRIDLSFLGTMVEDTSLKINYRTTVPDSALGSSVTQSVLQQAVLTLAEGGGGSGICDTDAEHRFTQGAFYSIGRAAMSVSLSTPSSQLMACEVVDLTITVNNVNARNGYNPLITLLNTGTEYDFVLPQAPVYGGGFTTGNIVFNANGGNNPVFEYTGGELTSEGTIMVQVRRRSANMGPPELSARMDYDSYQSETNTPVRPYQNTGNYAPGIVHKANLAVTVTPGTLTVIGSTVQYVIYVTNTDAGTAFNPLLTTELPDGVSINTALTDAVNTVPVEVAGSNLLWELNDITAGSTEQITVVLNIDTDTCSVLTEGKTIDVTWGCDASGVTVGRPQPDFFFPGGKMQLVHDSTQSVARFCGTGLIAITVRNTGVTEIFDVSIKELIPENSSIEISGDVRYRKNGGSPQTASLPPVIDEDLYEWTKDQIPDLARLLPGDEIRIEFDITSGVGLADTNPVLMASADARIACGNQVLSEAPPFSIHVERPRIEVSKTGKNNEVVGSVYGEHVYGGQGDVVEWRVVVKNTGNRVAQNLFIRDELSQSNPSNRIVNGPGLAVDTAYNPGEWISIADLAAGAEAVYIFRETLGNNCVTGYRTAEVTWGCNPTPNPGTNPVEADNAEIIMDPIIQGGSEITQTITSLPSGRARIDLVIRNMGGNANHLVITNHFPAGMVFDNTVSATLQSSDNASVTGVNTDSSNLSSPVFTLTGGGTTLLRYTEEVHIRYYVRTNVFDEDYATGFPGLVNIETIANGLDPEPPAEGTNTVRIDYENSCGTPYFDTDQAPLKLLVPDIDIIASSPNSGNNLLNQTTTQDYTFTITNNGPAGSVASNITLDFPGLGTGWIVNSVTLTTPGTGGSGGTASGPNHTFSPAQVGTLNAGQNAVVTLNLTYNEDNSNGSLKLLLRARGTIIEGDDPDDPDHGLYSYDQRAQRVLGVKITKERIATSEDDSNDANVFIGEEVTWRIRASLRGGEEEIKNLVIREQLRRGQATGSNHNNFGYVSSDTTVNHTMGEPTLSSTNNALTQPPVRSGRVDFNIGTVSAAEMMMGSTFEVDLVARVMNVTSNGNGQNRVNRVGMSFNYLGVDFYANNAGLEFSGDQARSELYAQDSVTIRRPGLTILKEARNLSQDPSGDFLANVSGQAGDVVEYRVTVRNNASATSAPLYSVIVEDTVHAKLELSDSDAGADTTGNDIADIINTLGIDVGMGQIVFDQDNTEIPTLGSNLERLDPGQEVVLLYRVTLGQGVHPSESLSSTVTATGQSIPAPHGNQSEPEGDPGNADGALVLTAPSAAGIIQVNRIQHGKLATEFSSHPDNDLLVYVGEQIRYQIQIELPQGTVPDFQVVDELPPGLTLISTPSVTIGSGISGGGQPVITPALLPANGGGGTLEIKWDFGQRVAEIGSTEAERTVTIEYIVQVRNIPANQSGVELVNRASYNFTGLPGDVVNLEEHTLTIAEPDVEVTKTVDPEDPVSAGDVLTYTVTIDNSSGTAPAYDLNLVDTLPLGVTYVPDSTNGIGEPDITGDAVNGWVLTWGREQGSPQKLDVATGGTLQFTYQVTVDDTSRPAQEYTNSVVADWTSLDGAPGPDIGIPLDGPGNELGERTGSGAGPNDYAAADDVTITALNNTAVTKGHEGETLPMDADGATPPGATAFRIGDLVTYTLDVQIQEATLNEFKVLDTLPGGLVFVETLSITPATGDDGFTYTLPVAGTTAPDTDATGELVWDFGTMVNLGDEHDDNDVLTIVYTARVADVAANPVPGDNNLTRSNLARVSFLKADNEPHVTDGSASDIIVSQPRLEIDKALIQPSGENILRPGEAGKFRITVTNAGSAPAYNLELMDLIPVGMRETTPVLTRAELNGTDVLAIIQDPSVSSWNAGTGEFRFVLQDDYFILPDQTLVLEYTFAIDNDAIKGETLINLATVEKYFSKPSVDVDHRREYDVPVSDQAPVIVGLEIRGFIYNDVEPNGHRDAFENWSDGAPVFVNLVNIATNTVFRSVEVLPGEGNYLLPKVIRGDYRIIVTDNAVNNGALAPSGWMFRSPPDGIRPVTLTVVDLHDEDFGLYEGLSITGLVFRDNGMGGGTANDGARNGGEQGISQVTVRLLNGSNVLDEVTTDGNGNFTLYITGGIVSGTPLIVEEVNPPVHVSTGAHVGNSGGNYDRATDRITFTFSGTSVSGIQFGDVPESALISDGSQTIHPGASAYYRHTFVAGTAGTVVFDTQSTTTPSLPWGEAMVFIDSDCSGRLEGQPHVNGQGIPVVAGQEICLIVRDSSPSGAPYGSRNLVQVRAHLTYDNATPALTELLTRQDLTTIGSASTAGLQLVKTVDKERAKPGEELTYVITYTNAGVEALTDLFIYDLTPHYTRFVSADYEVPPASLDPAVTVDAPDVGQAGSIRWTFTGSLDPGGSGQVSFKVQVLP